MAGHVWPQRDGSFIRRAGLRHALQAQILGLSGALCVAAPGQARASEPAAPTAEAKVSADPEGAARIAQEAEPKVFDPTARYRSCRFGRRWSCCPPGMPCIRSGAARLLLLSLGAVAGATAGGILFGLGDRLGGGDPATLLVGTGALAGAGALVGSMFGRLGGDAPGDPDRVRPQTIGLESTLGGTTVLDEVDPATLAMTFAPTLSFPNDQGRLRLVGHIGGDLVSDADTDPRPQNSASVSGQDGTRPVSIHEREFTTGAALDLAVSLPYPVMDPNRSQYLGATQLRYRPEFQMRREVFDAGGSNERVVERTMLLPLTVGVRWILSQRQRFTLYAGPRFDFIAFSEPGSKRMRRGGAQMGPIYGEAWYDIDFPFTQRPRRDGKQRRAAVIGQLSGGYIHSRFDGHGINFGPVIGFLGPAVVRWTTKVRPVGWPVALQWAVGAVIGNGVAFSVRAGVVLPNLGERKR
jgi:hypothetical protein